jgi:hypothetical protein
MVGDQVLRPSRSVRFVPQRTLCGLFLADTLSAPVRGHRPDKRNPTCKTGNAARGTVELPSGPGQFHGGQCRPGRELEPQSTAIYGGSRLLK